MIDHGSLLQLDTCVDDNEETQIIFVNIKQEFSGTVKLRFRNRKSACIWGLFVNPAFRHKGIGTLLIKKCFQIAKENGCQTLGLQVEKNNKQVIKFYNKLGFVFAYQYDNNDELMVIFL